MKDDILLDLARLEITLERMQITFQKLKEKMYKQDLEDEEKENEK